MLHVPATSFCWVFHQVALSAARARRTEIEAAMAERRRRREATGLPTGLSLYWHLIILETFQMVRPRARPVALLKL